MHRHRYNNVQLDGLTAGLLRHQQQHQPQPEMPLPKGGHITDKDKDNEQLPMWPSERIAPGGSGAFHVPKVEYSKETADLLKLLMKESKMSMIMRKQIDQSLRSGEPLPLPKPPRPNTSNDIDKETQAILERARNAKRKNLRQIESSGAYERSYFRPKVDNRMVSDKAKSRLQFTMAGIELPDPAIKPLRRTREDRLVTENDLINELLDQINERAEWLAEMEALGQGKKYRPEIHDQISERLHRIRSLETKIKMKADGGYRFVD
ncbi:UPF0193 protein EVG1 homolog [Drosophila mojavensis]|uniref:Uncharacterized protein n=1 Tax=Drosophila mojavensis TaxID=7230 RepID=B4KVW3_DROMO|nr:UPF0193 protein EVG1 homolog [Drosophila mojavensis]EDW19514.1 uncharacterized protein Dmoj_GI11485 [Drosophila mojavensis]